MKAVLWDFDGTIADTEPLWMEVEARLLSEHGVEVNQELLNSFVGMDAADTSRQIADLVPGRPLTQQQVARLIRQRAHEAIASHPLPLKPGVESLLLELRAEAVPCALVSASPRPYVDIAVEQLPACMFDVVISSDDVTCPKPDPEGYLLAMENLGVDADEVVIVEDSLPGTAAANATGAFVIAVPDQVPVGEHPRRIIVETLEGLTLATLRGIWEERSGVRG